MPTYYFDLVDKDGLSRDKDGTSLENQGEARAYSMRTLSEIVSDAQPNGEPLELTIVARDETEAVFFRASLTLQCEWLDQPGTARNSVRALPTAS